MHDAHEFWQPPDGGLGRVFWAITLPLSALIHLSTPDSRKPKWAEWYGATLILSLVWLVILATLMTSCLDALGCLIGFSSTVMGLTLGAIGTVRRRPRSHRPLPTACARAPSLSTPSLNTLPLAC